VPDSLRALIIVALLAGLGYGAIWMLANVPPQQTEIVRQLPSERLRQ
jgi:predicted O-methyltransferase YrrM